MDVHPVEHVVAVGGRVRNPVHEGAGTGRERIRHRGREHILLVGEEDGRGCVEQRLVVRVREADLHPAVQHVVGERRDLVLPRPEMRVLLAVEVILHVPSEPRDPGAERPVHVTPIGREHLVRHLGATQHGGVGVHGDRGIAGCMVGVGMGVDGHRGRLFHRIGKVDDWLANARRGRWARRLDAGIRWSRTDDCSTSPSPPEGLPGIGIGVSGWIAPGEVRFVVKAREANRQGIAHRGCSRGAEQ